MWNEWLARTLRPRPAQRAALKRAVVRAADEQSGVDDVRPSTGTLARAAQDEEVMKIAAEV